MLFPAREFRHMTLNAVDGEIGAVKDLYFDDEWWTVRYLVVDTGSWLSDELVLITPMSLMKPDWDSRVLPVTLTRDQVRNAPPIDTHEPVSRQHESDYLRYFGYPLYWAGPGVWGDFVDPYALAARRPGRESVESDRRDDAGDRSQHADVHLRSGQEVSGYHLHAIDGEIGHVDDFLVDTDSWSIRYLLVDTSNWIGGEAVLVAPQWARSIDWATRRILVDVPRAAIQESPRYDRSKLMDSECEERLRRHYRRPTF
jgi:uncharacterized protein YrrD